MTTLLVAGLAGCVGPFGAGADGEKSTAAGKGAAVGVATPDPGKMIAKATFDSPVAPGAKVEIGIVSLKTSGRLANLTLYVTPHVPGAQTTTVYRLLGGHSPDLYLLDTVNLKRHVVVKDSGGHALEPDYVLQDLPIGQPTLQNYTFAAPPDNVRTVDLHFGPFLPFRNVPVER
jgi:hypothetical protein